MWTTRPLPLPFLRVVSNTLNVSLFQSSVSTASGISSTSGSTVGVSVAVVISMCMCLCLLCYSLTGEICYCMLCAKLFDVFICAFHNSFSFNMSWNEKFLIDNFTTRRRRSVPGAEGYTFVGCGVVDSSICRSRLILVPDRAGWKCSTKLVDLFASWIVEINLHSIEGIVIEIW